MGWPIGILAAGDSIPWYVYLLAGFTIVYVAVIRPWLSRRKDPLERGGFKVSLSQQRTVEREMQNLLVELSEMARQIGAQLDTRSRKLEMLIDDADQRIARLQGTLGQPPSGAAPAIGAAATNPAEPVPAEHARVYALADEGKSPPQIAQQLGRPRGEVELILALRQRG